MISYSQGGVTVSLDGALENFARRLLDAAQDATVRELRAAAERVAATARARWYGEDGVTRRTGLSGRIETLLLIDATAGTVRISVGSTDSRLADGKPLPVYVHRPRATSTVLVDAPTTQAWYDALPALRGPWRTRADGSRWPQVYAPNPAASDGAYLLQTLVKSPFRRLVRRVVADLGQEIARRAAA